MDVIRKLLFLGLGSLLGSELGSRLLDSLLLNVGETSSKHFDDLLLEWGESSNFSDNFSDNLCSSGSSSFSGNWSGLPSLGCWSVDNLSVVESDVDTAFVVSFSHVPYFA